MRKSDKIYGKNLKKFWGTVGTFVICIEKFLLHNIASDLRKFCGQFVEIETWINFVRNRKTLRNLGKN